MAILSTDKVFFKEFEPKTKNRFAMYIGEIPAYFVKTANRPQITFEEIELNHINVKRYLKGKATWEPLEVSLYDPIVPSGAQAVMEWVRLHHESVSGRDGYSDFYKKEIKFQLLGPVGDVVEEWKLVGAFIQTANFNDLDFANGTDVADISLTLRYDYAILEY
jgi:hypothetical protein|tara:strand:+ start:2267 stop:2755 length:489 start_codon:yes stop_codon:yes gene_type:complete